jgi:N6-adenosine-specific RNA methylase IME4
MNALAKYDAACRALAEAAAVDEVKGVLDLAAALRAYARQAKNRDAELNAARIRVRAIKRLGEMIAEQKTTVGLAKGGQPYQASTCTGAEQVERPLTLEEAGIDRKLSSYAQKVAALGPIRFEVLMSMMADRARDGGPVLVDILKINSENEQRENRRTLARDLSNRAAELPSGRKYPCAYIDPPWHRKQGVTNRSYENHYPTMSWDDILALMGQVSDLLLPDAWVFLWIPRAHLLALHPVPMEFKTDDGEVLERAVKLPLAWAVARAAGCDSYSTCFVWTKTDEAHPDDIGGGIIVRDQDELLLLFKRGRGLPKPARDEIFNSNFRERKREHSRKPDHYRDMIQTMTGGLPVLELFARVDAEHPLPEGWDAWGNQAEPAGQDEAAPIDLPQFLTPHDAAPAEA